MTKFRSAFCVVLITLSACVAETGDLPDVQQDDASEAEDNDLIEKSNMTLAAQPNVVATVSSEDGYEMRFMELEPGAILVDESGPAGVDSPIAGTDFSELSATELFELAAPGQQIPKALLDASARATEKARVDSARPPARPSFPKVADGSTADPQAEPSSAKAVDDSLCRASWFQAHLCWKHTAAWVVCTVLRSGENWFTRHDTRSSHSAVCTYRGNVNHLFRIRTWYSWETKASFTVVQGRWHHVAWTQNLDYDHESRAYGGSGGYHFSGFGSHAAFPGVAPIYTAPYQ